MTMIDGIDPQDPWMLTCSGRRISLLHPDPASFTLDDICTSLNTLPRFTGHGQFAEPWSVADHSVAVGLLVFRSVGESWSNDHAKLMRTAFLHDAPEVVVNDVTSPMKRAMQILTGGGPSAFTVIEARQWSAIAERFDLYDVIPDVVHVADKQVCAWEADRLWGDGTGVSWGLPDPAGLDIDIAGCDLQDLVEQWI